MNLNKILFLTKYSKNGASSRIRTFQYLEYLESEILEKGYSVKVCPFFSRKYIELLYSNKILLHEILFAYVRRLFLIIFLVDKYNVVIIEKEIFPRFPKLFYKIFVNKKIPYLVDFDDATFDAIDSSILLMKYRYFLSNASKIVCGNQYLKSRVEELGGKNITLIPSVINEKRYIFNNDFRNNSNIVNIGWIGTPHTIKYLEEIIHVIDDLSKIYHINLITVGGEISKKVISATTINYQYVQWSIDTENFEVSKFDIGIMPLSNTNWEKGKCAYKLIQYMVLGIPVVASRISANIELLGEFEEYGQLAKNTYEWKIKLKLLIESPFLRKKMGALGRERVLACYSLNSQKKIYLQLLDELVCYSSKQELQ